MPCMGPTKDTVKAKKSRHLFESYFNTKKTAPMFLDLYILRNEDYSYYKEPLNVYFTLVITLEQLGSNIEKHSIEFWDLYEKVLDESLWMEACRTF